MKRKRSLKSVAVLLTLCLLMTTLLTPLSVKSAFGEEGELPAELTDIAGHWAENVLMEWIAAGKIQGYADGSFKPDQSISRSEFVALVNRVFHFTDQAVIDFKDVNASDWYYNDLAIAKAVGYIEGYEDGTFAGNAPIHREEAAMVLLRLLKLDDTVYRDQVAAFHDAGDIAKWSAGAVGAAFESGLIEGYENYTFQPQKPITRAEAVVMLSRAEIQKEGRNYNLAGEYGPIEGMEHVQRNVTVSAAGVTLRNMIIEGNLHVTRDVGEGEVDLNHITVKGTVTIEGGGMHSIYMNASSFQTVVIDRSNGTVRIVLDQNTTIANLVILSKSVLEMIAASVEGLHITDTAEETLVRLGEYSMIARVIVDAFAEFTGQGGIRHALIGENAGKSRFEKKPEQMDYENPEAETPAHTPATSAAPEPTAQPEPTVQPEPTEPAPSPTYAMVDNGVAKAVIVIPDQPIPIEEYAARELQYHIQESTAVTLSIVQESAVRPQDMLPVYIGHTQAALDLGMDLGALGPRSYAIRTEPDGIFIAGHDEAGSALDLTKDAGTLFGVYALIRNDMGAKWLWPGKLGEEIPQHQSIAIPHYNVVEQAQLQHTRWRNVGLVADVEGVSPAVKSQFLNDQNVWLRRHGFAEGISLSYGHAFTDYWNRFKDTNIEFFNLLPDGSRRPNHPYYPNQPSLISMNVGNVDFQAHVITNWLESRTEKKSWVNGIENDTPGLDRSPESLAMDDTSVPFAVPEGKEELYLPYSLSDRYAKWYLALLQQAKQHDPDAKVIGYAYENYSAPPASTQLNEDVVIGVVPSYIFPWTTQVREEFRDQWAGWYDKGATLYLRPNYTLIGHNMPTQYTQAFGEDFSYAYERGMIGTDFDSLTGMYGVQGPSLYMVARMHEAAGEDNKNISSILDEYYDAFGPASEKIRQYFEFWESATVRAEQTFAGLDEAAAHVDSIFADFHRVVDLLFDASDFEAAAELLDEAQIAAAGNVKVLQRIEFLEKGLTDAKLTRQMMALSRIAKSDPSQEVALITAVRELDAYRQSIASSNAVNVWYATWAENRTINRTLYQQYSKYDLLNGLPTTWDFKFDPNEVGLSEEWYDDSAPIAWDTIDIDDVWEKQPIGIAWKDEHGADYDGIAWYRSDFQVDELDEHLALLFGAVDKSSTVWVNGVLAGENSYDPITSPNAWKDPFSISLNEFIQTGNNTVIVRVESRSGVGGIYKQLMMPCPPQREGDTHEMCLLE